MSLKMRLSDDYLVRYEVTDNTEIFQIIYHLENKLIAIFTICNTFNLFSQMNLNNLIPS